MTQLVQAIMMQMTGAIQIIGMKVCIWGADVTDGTSDELLHGLASYVVFRVKRFADRQTSARALVYPAAVCRSEADDTDVQMTSVIQM